MKRPLITTRVLFNHSKRSQASLSPGAPDVGAVPPSPGTSSGVGGPCRHPPASAWVTAAGSARPGQKKGALCRGPQPAGGAGGAGSRPSAQA